MSKNGTLLSVAGDQEGANPRIVTETQGLPVDSFIDRIGRGLVPGHRVYIIPGRKDGVDSNFLDDLTQIPNVTLGVTPSPGGIQLRLRSTSAGDDVGGIGVQSVDIHYLDSSGIEQSETVIMAGIGAADTVATDIDVIQWMHTRLVGAIGVSVGNISLTDIAETATYEYIAAGGNQSLSARINVPAGHTGYITGWRCSGIVKQIDFRLRATTERFDRSLLPGVFLFQDTEVLLDSTSGWVPLPWLKQPAGSCIKMSGKSSAAGGNGGGSFQIVFIEDGF